MAESYVNPFPNFRAISGEDIVKGEIVSISNSDGLMYLACADAGNEELPAMGVAEAGSSTGDMALAKRLGQMDGYSSLSPGGAVYVSNTPGDISVTAGDTSQTMGIAVTDEQWIIDPEIIAQQTQH